MFLEKENLHSSTNTVIFDTSKAQTFNIHTGFRSIVKRLKKDYNVINNSDQLTENTFKDCKLFIISLPNEKFTEAEFGALRDYIKNGGNLLVLLGEGGESKNDTNINFLLEEFDIGCNPDSVIRTVFFKYFDPKEALIQDGVLNRAIGEMCEKSNKAINDSNVSQALTFVYPYGCTLTIGSNSSAILSTGNVCFPINRPICAFTNYSKDINEGKIVVIGSTYIFHDNYIDKEDNMKLFDVVIKYLINGFELNQLDSKNPDISEMIQLPDHVNLSGNLKFCLQEGDIDNTTPTDINTLFNQSIKNISLDMWPVAINAYEKLNLKHEPLTVIVPKFEIPLPPLQPAVFSPNFKELSPPNLELFDLDEAFSSTDVRLAQTTNRYLNMPTTTDIDLDNYIQEVGTILGINKNLSTSDRNSKRILEIILHHICEFKKADQHDDHDFNTANMYAEDDDGIDYSIDDLQDSRSLNGRYVTDGNDATNANVVQLVTMGLLDGFAVRKVKMFNDRVYLSRYRRSYWLGTKYYYLDHTNYFESRDTCAFKLNITDTLRLEYEDGGNIDEIIFQCMRYAQYCCGLDCCQTPNPNDQFILMMPELSQVETQESQQPTKTLNSTNSTQCLEVEAAALKEGLELLRSLEREPTGLPPYMGANVEKCKESINKIFKTTFNLIQARRAGTIKTDEHSRTKILLLKDAGQTLKRYLIVYHHERLNRIRRITRNTCGILGQSLKGNMSKNEQEFADKYYKLYIEFENEISENGLKLLTNNSLPKLEYYYYRCKEDYGEYELADGNIIIIKRGLIHHMPKENAETLLRSGIVEQVHM
uniref:ABC-type uncharacterized transport system domain-containing protein n=1 Tax=Strongyloides stercoralis TaxID=6248 RepID=A0AAF5DG85_STRER